MPVSDTGCGLLDAESVMVIEVDIVPRYCGLKLMLTVQVELLGIDGLHSDDETLKGYRMVMFVPVTAADDWLVRVKT